MGEAVRKSWACDDLPTAEGLQAALDEAVTWAELARRTGRAPSTLRGWGKKLGVRVPRRPGALVAVDPTSSGELTEPTSSSVDEAMTAVVTLRRQNLERALSGKATELSHAEFNLFVEVDIPLEQWDHLRLLRAASLAIDGYPARYVTRTERQYIERVAAACGVDAKLLDHYVTVVQADKKFRKSIGAEPVAWLPSLVDRDSQKLAPEDELGEEV